jgi:hypothetical protein
LYVICLFERLVMFQVRLLVVREPFHDSSSWMLSRSWSSIEGSLVSSSFSWRHDSSCVVSVRSNAGEREEQTAWKERRESSFASSRLLSSMAVAPVALGTVDAVAATGDAAASEGVAEAVAPKNEVAVGKCVAEAVATEDEVDVGKGTVDAVLVEEDGPAVAVAGAR